MNTAKKRPERSLVPGSQSSQIVELLAEHGPMTAAEIAEELHMTTQRVAATVSRMKPHRCHIGSTRRDTVRGVCRMRAVYHLGPGADAKTLKPLTRSELNRRYTERIKRRAASVFSLGVPPRKRRASAAMQSQEAA